MISWETTGSFNNMERFLKDVQRQDIFQGLQSLAQQGVAALAAATPIDTGETRDLWDYRVEIEGDVYRIIWTNGKMVGGTPLAILLQYGHGTGTGGYVEGRDFINPAIKPIFDQIAEKAWKVVTSL